MNKVGEDFSIIVKIDNSILPETIRNQSLLQTFNFEISINSNYPFNPPIIFCKDSVRLIRLLTIPFMTEEISFLKSLNHPMHLELH